MKTLLSFMWSFMLIGSSGFAANVTDPSISMHRIDSHEVEKDLENQADSSVSTVLAEFRAKGGTFIRLDGDAPPYHLAAGDAVFPACSGGNNRSQTLWGVLLPYADQITLMQPHATRYGFDPYN